ncbi:MAG: hypothetical protein WC450_04910 [Candidatus Omnitrophota bacterium]
MQIVIGVDNALKSLNGSQIKCVKADIIGLGDARVWASSGFVYYTENTAELVSRRGFYQHCSRLAHDALGRR